MATCFNSGALWNKLQNVCKHTCSSHPYALVSSLYSFQMSHCTCCNIKPYGACACHAQCGCHVPLTGPEGGGAYRSRSVIRMPSKCLRDIPVTPAGTRPCTQAYQKTTRSHQVFGIWQFLCCVLGVLQKPGDRVQRLVTVTASPVITSRRICAHRWAHAGTACHCRRDMHVTHGCS